MIKINIGMIDADLLDNGTRHPNLALMKISGYQKSKGRSVKLLMDYNDIDQYDHVYIAKVFSFTVSPKGIEEKKNVTIGGTGFYGDGDEESLAFRDYKNSRGA